MADTTIPEVIEKSLVDFINDPDVWEIKISVSRWSDGKTAAQ